MRHAVRLKHTFHCRIRDSVREEACQFYALIETSYLRRFRLKCSLITSVSAPTENVWIAPTNMGGKTIFRWVWRPQGTVSCWTRPKFDGNYSCSHLFLDPADLHLCLFPIKALCWVLGAGSLWVDTVWELGDTVAILTASVAVFHQNCVCFFLCVSVANQLYFGVLETSIFRSCFHCCFDVARHNMLEFVIIFCSGFCPETSILERSVWGIKYTCFTWMRS